MAINKKGISPLIATVLIIGFTVALAAVIMVWGQGFIKGMQEKTQSTSDAQLACAQDVVVTVSDACIDGVAGIKVTIKNDGNKNVDSLTLRAYEQTSKIASVSNALTGALNAFAVKTVTVPAASLVGVTLAQVKQVEAIPIITVAGKQITCAQSVSLFPIGALPAAALPNCPP